MPHDDDDDFYDDDFEFVDDEDLDDDFEEDDEEEEVQKKPVKKQARKPAAPKRTAKKKAAPKKAAKKKITKKAKPAASRKEPPADEEPTTDERLDDGFVDDDAEESPVAAEVAASDNHHPDAEVDSETSAEEDEYGRPAPQANYVVHVYELKKYKRTIDRQFTPEEAEAFVTEYNRTSKAYNRWAVPARNDVEPGKELAP